MKSECGLVSCGCGHQTHWTLGSPSSEDFPVRPTHRLWSVQRQAFSVSLSCVFAFKGKSKRNAKQNEEALSYVNVVTSSSSHFSQPRATHEWTSFRKEVQGRLPQPSRVIHGTKRETGRVGGNCCRPQWGPCSRVAEWLDFSGNGHMGHLWSSLSSVLCVVGFLCFFF